MAAFSPRYGVLCVRCLFRSVIGDRVTFPTSGNFPCFAKPSFYFFSCAVAARVFLGRGAESPSHSFSLTGSRFLSALVLDPISFSLFACFALFCFLYSLPANDPRVFAIRTSIGRWRGPDVLRRSSFSFGAISFFRAIFAFSSRTSHFASFDTARLFFHRRVPFFFLASLNFFRV